MVKKANRYCEACNSFKMRRAAVRLSKDGKPVEKSPYQSIGYWCPDCKGFKSD